MHALEIAIVGRLGLCTAEQENAISVVKRPCAIFGFCPKLAASAQTVLPGYRTTTQNRALCSESKIVATLLSWRLEKPSRHLQQCINLGTDSLSEGVAVGVHLVP